MTRALTFILIPSLSAVAMASDSGEEPNARLEQRLNIFSEIRHIARENAKIVSNDWSMPAELKRRLKAAVPDTLTSIDLFSLALLCRIAQDGAAEDHRYDDVFWSAELQCAHQFIGRPDGLYWLKRLRCGTDGGTAEILDEYIAAAEKKRTENSHR